MANTRKKARVLPRRFHSLAAAIEAQGITQRQAAVLIGKDEPYVSKLVNRKARPSLEMAVRIERLFNVDPAGML